MVRLLTVLLAVLALVPAAASAQQVIRLAHVGFPGSIYDIAATEYVKRVNEALKGKVEMRHFHSSQLGTDEAMIKGIKFEMPYIIVSRAHMKRVTEDPGVKKALFDGLPQQGT